LSDADFFFKKTAKSSTTKKHALLKKPINSLTFVLKKDIVQKIKTCSLPLQIQFLVWFSVGKLLNVKFLIVMGC